MPVKDPEHVERENIESELKSEVAKARPRDREGQFVRVERSEDPEQSRRMGPLDKLFSRNVHYSKNQDDLLDVRVGNPLHRIVELLEDIKRQKAFSFTLKGSLGIAGVALALGVFGVFGGGKILCEKGVQSYIGTVKTLNVMEQESSGIPVLSQFLDYFAPKQMHNRTVLVKQDFSVLNVIGNNKTIEQYNNMPVIITGSYNSCAQTLIVKEQEAIQTFAR